MTRLADFWQQAAALSEDEMPEDLLEEIDPAAYDRVQARKARKLEEAENAVLERRMLETRKRDQDREDEAQLEAAVVRTEHWDNATTEYGGEHISQAEAQRVRVYIVDHRAEVVAYGRQTGQFATDAEGHRFVDREARLHELNAADRDGTLSEDGQAERARLEEQQLPYAGIQGHFWDVRQRDRALPEVAGQSVKDASADSPFRSKAPDMRGSFDYRAGLPEEPRVQPLPEPARPSPVSDRSLAAAGLS